MTATVDTVRQGFQRLREVCDPQGWALLDELEQTCVLAVAGCDTLAEAIERYREQEAHELILERRIAEYGDQTVRVQHLRSVS